MPPRPPFRGKGQNYRGNHNGYKKPYVYIPAPNSGAYAILVSMYKAEQDDLIRKMSKEVILNYCNKFSQSSLRDNSKVWASMKGLIDKSLVSRDISRHPEYWLESEGKDLAKKLIATSEGTTIDEELSLDYNDNPVTSSQYAPTSSQSQSCDSYEPETVTRDTNGQVTFELKAGTFDIILVTDNREKIEIINPDNSIKTDLRQLACGDFIWLARPKGAHPADKTKDLVLDYVIERKRMDDLWQSIKDGRFEQQKYRMKDSGIRRPMYLIEDYGVSNLSMGGQVNREALNQAAVNIFVQEGIDVERAKSQQHSNDFLINMTKCLQRYYLGKDLRSCSQDKLKQQVAESNEFMTYSEFQSVTAPIKNWTVREMFAKHLIQITGMSDVRVAVILKQYPTILALLKAYKQCDTKKERENMLSKMSIPDSNRTLGPKLSERVCRAYTFTDDDDDDDDNDNDLKLDD